jgi:hypothetical protein
VWADVLTNFCGRESPPVQKRFTSPPANVVGRAKEVQDIKPIFQRSTR